MMEIMGAVWLIALVAINVVFGVFVGWVAGKKGRSVIAWFFASVFLTPIIALLGLIAVGDEKTNRNEATPRSPRGREQDHRWWG